MEIITWSIQVFNLTSIKPLNQCRHVLHVYFFELKINSRFRNFSNQEATAKQLSQFLTQALLLKQSCKSLQGWFKIFDFLPIVFQYFGLFLSALTIKVIPEYLPKELEHVSGIFGFVSPYTFIWTSFLAVNSQLSLIRSNFISSGLKTSSFIQIHRSGKILC